MSSPAAPASTHAPRPADEGPVLWPWGIGLVWVVCGLLGWRGHWALALAGVGLVAPWFILQILPIGTSSFVRGYRTFRTGEKAVWLTIDDGPDPATTARFLDLLASRGMKATFFLIGRKARAHPDLVARIAAAGHEIACHTESHPAGTFWHASGERMRTEVDHCAVFLRQFATVRYFRPPAGLKGPWLRAALGRSGLTLVLWSARGLDGLPRSPERSLERLRRQVRPGGIVLVHEVSADPERSVRYVELVTGWLASSGYATALPEPSHLRAGKGVRGQSSTAS